MKYLYFFLFPSLLWAEKPNKVDKPHWLCEGYIQGYDENNPVIENRWGTIKKFKLEGPTQNSNTVVTTVAFDKHEARVNFVYNPYGTMSIAEETVKSEGVSLSVGVGDESFGGSSFQVMDPAGLPKTIGLRVDFEYQKKPYFVRLICNRNKK